MSFRSQSTKGDIVVEIQSEKDCYSTPEEIILTVHIKNGIQNSVYVNHRQVVNYSKCPAGQGDLLLMLQGPEGYLNLKKKHVHPKRLSKEHWKRLEPSQIIEKVIRLDKYYSLQKPGTYEIQIGFDNRNPDQSEAEIQEIIYSNRLKIVMES